MSDRTLALKLKAYKGNYIWKHKLPWLCGHSSRWWIIIKGLLLEKKREIGLFLLSRFHVQLNITRWCYWELWGSYRHPHLYLDLDLYKASSYVWVQMSWSPQPRTKWTSKFKAIIISDPKLLKSNDDWDIYILDTKDIYLILKPLEKVKIIINFDKSRRSTYKKYFQHTSLRFPIRQHWKLTRHGLLPLERVWGSLGGETFVSFVSFLAPGLTVVSLARV